MKHCPSHGAGKQFEGGDPHPESEKLLDIMECYKEQYVALSDTHKKLDAWMLEFVAIKPGMIVDERKVINHLACTLAAITVSGRFSGWRDHPPRMRVDEVRVYDGSMRHSPRMEVLLYGVPVKFDGTPFMNASSSMKIDIGYAIDIFDEARLAKGGAEISGIDQLSNYVEYVLAARAAETKGEGNG